MRTASIVAGFVLSSFLPLSRAADSTDLSRVSSAEQRWAGLGASSYEYTLGTSVGAPFGWGEYHIKVNGSYCSARHFGGTGFGKPRFFERFRYVHVCKDLLPADLFRELTASISNGFHLEQFEVHPKYGFPLKAFLDTDKMEDQSWGFEITNFKLLGRPGNGP